MAAHEVEDVDHWLDSPVREELLRPAMAQDGVRPDTVRVLLER